MLEKDLKKHHFVSSFPFEVLSQPIVEYGTSFGEYGTNNTFKSHICKHNYKLIIYEK